MKSKDKEKRVTELTMAMVMQPYQANIMGNVHGGEIMKLMDNVAGAVAIQYAKCNVVTARVDELEFILPINVGSLVTCTGRIAYVGNTSMEVIVTVDVEDLKTHNEKERALKAFFTMVAMDENKKPTKVPELVPETEDEKKVCQIVEERRKHYKARKNSK